MKPSKSQPPRRRARKGAPAAGRRKKPATPARPPHLREIVATLEGLYGVPPPPVTNDPFDLIVLENAAYLVDDERRLTTWRALRNTVGTRPADLLAAGADRLTNLIREGGMFPTQRTDKLLRAATLAQERFAGDLTQALRLPLAQARRELKRFPGIGDPGADKLLLFTHTQPVLALESNGPRCLLRVGFGVEGKSYAQSYKSVQAATLADLPASCDELIAAYQLLRTHGQFVCRRNEPRCGACPLRSDCAYGRSHPSEGRHDVS